MLDTVANILEVLTALILAYRNRHTLYGWSRTAWAKVEELLALLASVLHSATLPQYQPHTVAPTTSHDDGLEELREIVRGFSFIPKIEPAWKKSIRPSWQRPKFGATGNAWQGLGIMGFKEAYELTKPKIDTGINIEPYSFIGDYKPVAGYRTITGYKPSEIIGTRPRLGYSFAEVASGLNTRKD